MIATADPCTGTASRSAQSGARSSETFVDGQDSAGCREFPPSEKVSYSRFASEVFGEGGWISTRISELSLSTRTVQ